MRKSTKIIIWIGSSVIGALLITALILGLITIRSLDSFAGYNGVSVMNRYDSYQYYSDLDNTSLSDKDKLIGDALKTVKFSVLRASLEGKFSYRAKGTEFTNSDEETERKKISISDLKSLEPKEGEFMLLFSYSQPQRNPLFMTDDVDVLENGEIVQKSVEIVYNRLILIIPERNGEVQDVKLYPYYTANIDNQNALAYWYDGDGKIGSEWYNIYEFNARMYTSKLYDKFIENDTFAPGEYKVDLGTDHEHTGDNL